MPETRPISFQMLPGEKLKPQNPTGVGKIKFKR